MVSQANGKKWNDYSRNASTQEFLAALASEAGIPVSLLVESRKGVTSGGREQGTWVHPKVAMHLAQWCSPRFAVVVSGWVLDLLTTGKAQVVTDDADPILTMIESAKVNRLRQIEMEKKLNAVEVAALTAGNLAGQAIREARAATRTLDNQYGWYTVLAYCNRTGRRCSVAESAAAWVQRAMKGQSPARKRVAERAAVKKKWAAGRAVVAGRRRGADIPPVPRMGFAEAAGGVLARRFDELVQPTIADVAREVADRLRAAGVEPPPVGELVGVLGGVFDAMQAAGEPDAVGMAA